MSARLFGMLLTGALLSARVDAQVAPGVTLAPGARVRITVSDNRPQGELLSHDADTLRIRAGGAGVRAWAFTDVRRLEVRGGRDRRRGFIRGALILGGIGLVAGGIDASNGDLGGGEYVWTVVTNGLIGGAIGVLLSPRGWRDVPLLRRT